MFLVISLILFYSLGQTSCLFVLFRSFIHCLLSILSCEQTNDGDEAASKQQFYQCSECVFGLAGSAGLSEPVSVLRDVPQNDLTADAAASYDVRISWTELEAHYVFRSLQQQLYAYNQQNTPTITN